MKLVLMSSGKDSVLSGHVDADCFLDCRIMHNPYRDPVLGGLNGDHPMVQEWIRKKNKHIVESFKQAINTGLETAESRNSFKSEPTKPFRVCFFCLAGVHRSRGMKNVIAQDFKQAGYDVEVI